jgi:hypothetical protein
MTFLAGPNCLDLAQPRAGVDDDIASINCMTRDKPDYRGIG